MVMIKNKIHYQITGDIIADFGTTGYASRRSAASLAMVVFESPVTDMPATCGASRRVSSACAVRAWARRRSTLNATDGSGSLSVREVKEMILRLKLTESLGVSRDQGGGQGGVGGQGGGVGAHVASEKSGISSLRGAGIMRSIRVGGARALGALGARRAAVPLQGHHLWRVRQAFRVGRDDGVGRALPLPHDTLVRGVLRGRRGRRPRR